MTFLSRLKVMERDNMESTFSQRHPLIVSILYTLLAILISVAAGVVVSITKAEKIQQCIIYATGFGISAVVGLLLMKRSRHTFKEYGFCFSSKEVKREKLWFISLVLMEISAFFAGPIAANRINAEFVAVAFFLTLAVGVNEEVYFRGLILKVLDIKGTRFAIVVSSTIFGISHLTNILDGRTIEYILLQIVFSFLFGLVCAAIVVRTSSILVPIVWHFFHDFIVVTTGPDVITTQALAVLVFQVAILVGYSIYLLKKIWKDTTPRQLTDASRGVI